MNSVNFDLEAEAAYTLEALLRAPLTLRPEVLARLEESSPELHEVVLERYLAMGISLD